MLGDPAAQAGPFVEQRLVGDLDGRPAGGGIAVEGQEPVTAECVQHQRHALVAERCELPAEDTPPGDLVTITEADEPQHHLLRGGPGPTAPWPPTCSPRSSSSSGPRPSRWRAPFGCRTSPPA